ncbi:hypothetical protein [Pontibacter sp. G13]|uniref:hypothetical protein n=1 Tax=Pontibacter sp. G13 TaxID=3074898 RepID=UPI00288C0E34|nr:hypothetical protein [Pontibacter sp. G13]WNJ19102.1 hypothetical protein RJD25_01310 [Pontibacter sp. G13]
MKVDSLYVFDKMGFGETGQTLQHAYLDAQLKLRVVDSTMTWDLNEHADIDSTTIQLKVSETTYLIQEDGQIVPNR